MQVVEKKRATTLRDFQIQTDRQVMENQLDNVVVDNVDKKAAVMEKNQDLREDGEDEGPRAGAAPADPWTIIHARKR